MKNNFQYIIQRKSKNSKLKSTMLEIHQKDCRRIENRNFDKVYETI